MSFKENYLKLQPRPLRVFLFCFVLFCFLLFLFFFGFLGLHLQQMEVPRLGVKSELQLLAYATATAMQDLGHVCNLHCSSQQRRILNSLN